MTRLDGALDEPGLVAYLVGDHPDREAFHAYADALVEAGVSVLEVGIPFSDPIADGPTIQSAVTEALEAGVRPPDVVEAMGEIRERHPEVPLVAMTYANIAHRVGYETFGQRLAEAGVDGAILADHPPEAVEHGPDCLQDVDQVFLAGPATDDERLAHLARRTQGFLYVVGLFGTTGAREELDPRTVELVERVAPVAAKHDTPTAVGFGVSKGDHARRLVEAGADGVVVGSAFVDKVLEGEDPAALGDLAEELVDGIEAAGRS
jgi:tryptophan synthase alpha chain